MTDGRANRKMSADVKGYSRLMSLDEEGTVKALNDCREIIAKFVEESKPGRSCGTCIVIQKTSVVSRYARSARASRFSVSLDVILAFLDHLESDRNNEANTRNQRLAVIKSLAKMIRLMHPQHRKVADIILSIPQKKSQKKIVEERKWGQGLISD